MPSGEEAVDESNDSDDFLERTQNFNNKKKKKNKKLPI